MLLSRFLLQATQQPAQQPTQHTMQKAISIAKRIKPPTTPTIIQIQKGRFDGSDVGSSDGGTCTDQCHQSQKATMGTSAINNISVSTSECEQTDMKLIHYVSG